jgi:S-adenosylmethionine:tRNA ribosyltransferase-isomerase
MRVSDLDYELPPELIAQRPAERRDESRLLVFDRARHEVRHRRFRELPEELAAGDVVVLNDTRVLSARLRLVRSSGGSVEVLLLEQRGPETWEVLARPARRLRVGELLRREVDPVHGTGASVELIERLDDGRWLVTLHGEIDGDMPLPPYIRERLNDPERYQTVYAAERGSAAAPTAGLHVTPALLDELEHTFVTLHIGLDTFRPVNSETLEEHRLHGERFSVSQASWKRIEAANRVVAIGTSVARVVESVAERRARGAADALEGRTELMIAPGHDFEVVGALVTNFHLPKSTLLALVMAFAGIEETRELYELAIAERYRFYSFGDAMLVL